MYEDDNEFHFWIGSIGLVVFMVYLMIWLIEAYMENQTQHEVIEVLLSMTIWSCLSTLNGLDKFVFSLAVFYLAIGTSSIVWINWKAEWENQMLKLKNWLISISKMKNKGMRKWKKKFNGIKKNLI